MSLGDEPPTHPHLTRRCNPSPPRDGQLSPLVFSPQGRPRSFYRTFVRLGVKRNAREEVRCTRRLGRGLLCESIVERPPCLTLLDSVRIVFSSGRASRRSASLRSTAVTARPSGWRRRGKTLRRFVRSFLRSLLLAAVFCRRFLLLSSFSSSSSNTQDRASFELHALPRPRPAPCVSFLPRGTRRPCFLMLCSLLVC